VGLRPSQAALFLAALLAACGGATSGATPTTTPPSTALKLENGGTVTIAVSSLPSEFNPSTPAGSNEITQMVMEQVWPQAFVVGPGMVARTGPGLVTSAELVSIKPETIVYTLAKHARWSDGVPITASDFIYDWHEFTSVGAGLPASFPFAGYELIKSISGSNKGKTVTVVFTKNYADWNALFSNLVPAHIAERYGWTAAFSGPSPKHLVSGGPFTVTRVVPGKELVLSRNRAYWGTAPRLSHIVFLVEPSQAATLRALRVGTVNLAETAPGPRVSTTVLQSTDLVEAEGLSPNLWQLDFNLADPLVSSLGVREAVAKAIDRTELVADSSGLLSAQAFAATNHLYGIGVPGHRPNGGSYAAADVAMADQLVEGAGYSINARGLVVGTSGAPLVLTVTGPTNDPTINRVEDELQAELLQAGMELQIQNVSLSTLLGTTLPQGQYELALAPYLLTRFPSTTMELYTNPVGPTPRAPPGTNESIQIAPLGGSTFIAGNEAEPSAVNAGVVTRDVLGFDDSTVDSTYAQALSQLNFGSDSDLYNAIDAALWSDMAVLPLFQEPLALVRADNIVNVAGTPTWAGPMWNAEDWAIQVSPPPTTSTTSPGS